MRAEDAAAAAGASAPAPYVTVPSLTYPTSNEGFKEVFAINGPAVEVRSRPLPWRRPAQLPAEPPSAPPAGAPARARPAPRADPPRPRAARPRSASRAAWP